jgi:hypothetical protein
MLDQLNGVTAMLDTPLGLVATVPDSDFSGPELHPAVSGQLARLAAIVMAHPGLRIDVEGNSDTSAGKKMSPQRADAVQRADRTRFPGKRSNRPRVRGQTPVWSKHQRGGARRQPASGDRDSGDPISDLPLWDHPYTLVPTL